MLIEDFLLARLDWTEERVSQLVMSPEARAIFSTFIENQRAIIELHKKWPVMLEKPAELVVDNVMDSLINPAHDFIMSMKQQIAFLTQEEYINRFGTEPPTAPMLKQMAWSWRNHPDWNPEWAYDGR